MSQKWSALIGVCAIALLAGWLLILGSCAHDKQLIAITIQPAGGTFPSPNTTAPIQFAAIGSYIHPPVSSDITNQVTWQTDVAALVTVTNGAVVPTGKGCGIANISASTTKGTGPSGNLIIGYATVTVDDLTVPTCPGGTTTQSSVTVSLTGSGTVVSVPAGINCPSAVCGALFTVGSSVVLNATLGAGSTSITWGNCTAAGNSCSVVVGSSPTVVTALFQ
jgi:hypothetical protein